VLLREFSVRLRDGQYECAQCGKPLGLKRGAKPRVEIHETAGKRRTRVIVYEGREIHRCEIGDSA